MRQSRRQKREAASTDIVEHADENDTPLQDPSEFLDRAHPENDQYMKSVEHVQRQIMHATITLRPKQVQILKTVFAGNNYTQTGALHYTHPSTVSRLVKSPDGQRLLNLLQYHLKLIEGPNEAQRRNMLWRIAQLEERLDPKTAIKAIEALNKMHFQQAQIENPQLNGGGQAPTTQVTININQDLMPRTALDS